MPAEMVCQTCAVKFYVPPSVSKKRKYCSQACNPRVGNQTTDKTGDKNPNWKGGVVIENRRTKIYAPNHPNANRDGYVYQYRIVAAEILGRPLTDDEIVHHIDGDVTNDSPKNLQVMTQSEHCSIHTTALHAAGRIRIYNGPKGKDGRFLSAEERAKLRC